VEANFPIMRVKDGVGQFVETSDVPKYRSEQGVKPNRRTWTKATVTSWPLAALYMCFCACQEIVSIHTKYRT